MGLVGGDPTRVTLLVTFAQAFEVRGGGGSRRGNVPTRDGHR
jgi:hypothetical protein